MANTKVLIILSAISLTIILGLNGCSSSTSSTTDPTAKTGCASVVDTPSFEDALGWRCWNWIGWSCDLATAQSWNASYTSVMVADIVKNCPAACASCKAARNFTFQGDYTAVIGTRSAKFLEECSAKLTPVVCTFVFSGSIIVTLGGKDQAALDAKTDELSASGLNLPSFTPLTTGCAPGSCTCNDNLAFRDAFGWACFTWIGWDCSAATYLTPNYTQAQQNAILSNCALSCTVGCQFAQNLTMNEVYASVVTDKTAFMQQCNAAVAPAYCLEVSSNSTKIMLSLGSRNNATLDTQISTIKTSNLMVGSHNLTVASDVATSTHRRRTPANTEFATHRRRVPDSPHRRRSR